MSIYQLKVTLRNIDPPIWRRIQIKSDLRLDKLHDLLQIVMGWEHQHLHGFRVGRKNYGAPDRFGDTVDERTVRLASIASVGDKLVYEYDFGDSWEHELEIETALEPEPGVHYPVCLAGARACPLEDCGGFPGYEHLFEALRDPANEEHAERLEWLGDFDPEAFDLDKINTRLGNRALAPVPPTPGYTDDELAGLEPQALLELMIRDEDRVPRNVIDACARHGDAMAQCLSVVIKDDRYWDEAITRGEWWLLLHTAMILGLIPTALAGQLLADFMLRLAEEEEETGPDDWLDAKWPALFRNKPDDVLPALRALSMNGDFDWFIRTQAITTVVSFAQRGPMLDSELDWVAVIAADEQEDWDTRLCSGMLLLEFPRDRHRALLDDLAARQTGWNIMFASSDVTDAYAEMQGKPEWEQFQNPWDFYSPAQIEKRCQRWATELQAPIEDDDLDELDDVEPNFGTSFSVDTPFIRAAPKVGRNDPCPCGSGKKYKKCCLQLVDDVN